MGERRGTKALELWCRRITEGYPGVRVDNMTTSWRDGLAFCALIHHFRPDLIDFSSLKKEDVYHNNELAFRTAEAYLGIPALLDAEDMAQYAVPDRLSMLTYLSQYYQVFASSSGSSPSRLLSKRTSASKDDNLPASPSSASPPTKMSSSGLGRREPCTCCGEPVFLAQRLIVNRNIYHRTCFRCARCNAQLSFAEYCQIQADGQYCCEACPDEEESLEEISDDSSDENCEINTNMESETFTSGVCTSLQNSSPSESITSNKQKSSTSIQFIKEQMTNIEDDSNLCALSGNPPFKIETSVDSKYLNKEITAPIDSHVHTNEEDNNVCKVLPISEAMQKTDQISEKVISVVCDISDVSQDSNKNVQNIENESVSSISVDEKLSNESISLVSIKEESVETENINAEVVDMQQSTFSDEKINENDSKIVMDRSSACIGIEDKNTKDNFEIKKSDLFNDNKSSNDNSSNLSIVKMRMKMFDPNYNESVMNETNNSKTIPKRAVENDPAKVELSCKDTNNLNIGTDVSKLSNNNVEVCLDTSAAEENNTSEDRSFIVDVPYNNTNMPADKDSIPLIEIIDHSSDDVNTHEGNDENNEHKVNSVGTDTVQSENHNIELEQNKVTESHVVSESTENTVIKEVKTPELDEETSKQEMNEESGSCVTTDKVTDSPIASQSTENIVIKEIEESNLDVSIKRNNDGSNLKDTSTKDEQKKNLNPFDDDNDDEVTNDDKANDSYKNSTLNSSGSKNKSLNPFDSDSDEDVEGNTNVDPIKKKKKEKPPRPPPPAILINSSITKKVVQAPVISLNPFSSDEDENSDEENLPIRKPVPTPRQRINEEPTSLLNTQIFHGSSSSLTSTTSRRKKAPAPKPPSKKDTLLCLQKTGLNESYESLKDSSITSQTSEHRLSQISPQISPHSKKRRPAPLPPISGLQPTANSTLIETVSMNTSLTSSEDFSISSTDNKFMSARETSKKLISAAEFSNDPDIITLNDTQKSEEKSMIEYTDSEDLSLISPDKNQLKRRKGPAPAIPLLRKRNIGISIPPAVLRKELQLLEAQQMGLERQGVRLEEIIRERCEGAGSTVDENHSTPDPETDELVLQLFELVNEKNELFRRQAELMYIRRQQRLEEEYVDLEHQIRLLMARPEVNKTDSDKEKEEQLIQRLLEVVEKRNEVIASLEMDRVREREEDKSIREHMASHRAKRDESGPYSSLETSGNIPKLEKKKERKKWLKKEKNKKPDNEKLNENESTKKEKKHKKWF